MKDLKTVLAPFQKEPKELLEYLCKNVKNQTLEKISQADYGHNADAYLKELKKIRDNKDIQKMKFDVKLSEVVELTRWQKAVETKDKWITNAQKDNLAIAFSCVILLTVPCECYYNRMSEDSSIIQLIRSGEYLQNVFPKIFQKISHLLAWRIMGNGTEQEDVPFFMLGLILTLLKSGEYQETEIIDLAEQLLIIEQKLYEKEGFSNHSKSSDWLFKNTLLQKTWQLYQPFFMKQIDKAKSEELKAKLKQLANLLA